MLFRFMLMYFICVLFYFRFVLLVFLICCVVVLYGVFVGDIFLDMLFYVLVLSSKLLYTSLFCLIRFISCYFMCFVYFACCILFYVLLLHVRSRCVLIFSSFMCYCIVFYLIFLYVIVCCLFLYFYGFLFVLF